MARLAASPAGEAAATGQRARGFGVRGGLQAEDQVTVLLTSRSLPHCSGLAGPVHSPSLKGQMLVLTESGSRGHT